MYQCLSGDTPIIEAISSKFVLLNKGYPGAKLNCSTGNVQATRPAADYCKIKIFLHPFFLLLTNRVKGKFVSHESCTQSLSQANAEESTLPFGLPVPSTADREESSAPL